MISQGFKLSRCLRNEVLTFLLLGFLNFSQLAVSIGPQTQHLRREESDECHQKTEKKLAQASEDKRSSGSFVNNGISRKVFIRENKMAGTVRKVNAWQNLKTIIEDHKMMKKSKHHLKI